MKKMLLTVITAGVLAVPVGVLVAEDTPTDPADPVPTSTDPDQVRDRARRADDAPAAADEENEARECDGEGPQSRQREQRQAEECDGDGPQSRQKEQRQAEECNGEGPLARRREQNRIEEETGDGTMARQREQYRLEDDTAAADQAREVEPAEAEEGTPPSTPERAGGQVDTGPDDGANLQRRHGRD